MRNIFLDLKDKDIDQRRKNYIKSVMGKDKKEIFLNSQSEKLNFQWYTSTHWNPTLDTYGLLSRLTNCQKSNVLLPQPKSIQQICDAVPMVSGRRRRRRRRSVVNRKVAQVYVCWSYVMYMKTLKVLLMSTEVKLFSESKGKQ